MKEKYYSFMLGGIDVAWVWNEHRENLEGWEKLKIPIWMKVTFGGHLWSSVMFNIEPCDENQTVQLGEPVTLTCCQPSWMAAITRNHQIAVITQLS